MDETKFGVVSCVICLFGTALIWRIIWCLPCCRLEKRDTRKTSQKRSLMVMLGSGGHTGEMIKILDQFEPKVHDKFITTYVISDGDSTSLSRISKVEEPRCIFVSRARLVGEGHLSAIYHTLRSVISIVCKIREIPDILLINGPGTCVPLAYILFLYKVIGLGHTKIVYVESLARVTSLSVSGKLVKPIADRMIVQWANDERRCECYGILV